jgi:hypothetical protein
LTWANWPNSRLSRTSRLERRANELLVPNRLPHSRRNFGEAIEVDFKKLGEVHQKLNVQIGGFAAL